MLTIEHVYPRLPSNSCLPVSRVHSSVREGSAILHQSTEVTSLYLQTTLRVRLFEIGRCRVCPQYQRRTFRRVGTTFQKRSCLCRKETGLRTYAGADSATLLCGMKNLPNLHRAYLTGVMNEQCVDIRLRRSAISTKVS